MALETVIYPQDSLVYGCKEFYGGGGWGGYDFSSQGDVDKAFLGMLEDNTTASMDNQSLHGYWDPNSSPEACTGGGDHHPSLLVDDGSLPAAAAAAMEQPPATLSAAAGRRKRRRTRTCKNKEELENQRMTHIAVERNRRKQMNEYLAVIRSMMPPSYVQRGDQASIIGGAINFVKELEQHLQTLEAHNCVSNNNQPDNADVSSPPLFADFFTFPQYSKTQGGTNGVGSSAAAPEVAAAAPAESRSALADIEVTMVESHANLKILSKKRPRQLLKIVANLQYLWLTVLHLNVTTVDQMVLYSLSVKLEDGCQLTTVDEIADAVHQLLARIQEEAAYTS